MGEWRIRRGETEFVAPDLATLQQWARNGRVSGIDYVLNPVLNRWMFAHETPELSTYLGAQVARPKVKGISTAAGCLILLVLGFILIMYLASDQPSTSRPTASSTPTSTSGTGAERRAREVAALGPKGRELCEKNPTWPASDCDTVARGKINIGMSAEMVREAWGRPETINTTITGTRRHEQWVYGSGQYVYVDDGVVTSIQKSE